MEKKQYQDIAKTKKRLTILAVLTSFIFILLLALILKGIFSTPIDGLAGHTYKNEFVVDRVYFPELKDQIKVGDRIIAVDDVLFRPSELGQFGGQEVYTQSKIADQEPFIYRIKRTDSTTTQVAVKLRQLNFLEFFSAAWSRIILAAIFLALGLFLIVRNTLDRNVWTFFVFSVFGIFGILNPSSLYTFLTRVNLRWHYPIAAMLLEIGDLVSYMAFAAFLRFAMEFPSANYNKEKYENLSLWGIYGPPALFAILTIVCWFLELDSLYTFFESVLQIITACFAVIATALSIYVYRKCNNPLEKMQMRWLFFPFIFIILPAFAIYRVAYQYIHIPPISFDFLLVLAILVPIAVTVALIRYNLFAIDAIIDSIVVYGLTLGSTLVLFIETRNFLPRLFAGIAGELEPLLTDTFSILLVIIVFLSFRYYIHKIIDTLFYKEKLVARTFLRDISRKLAISKDYEELAKIVLTEITERLHIEKAWLFAKRNGTPHLISIGVKRTNEEKKFIDAILDYLSNHSKTFNFQYVEDDELEENEHLLKEKRVRIIIPLKHANQLIGLYVLSTKLNHLPYSHEEAQILEAIAYQLTVALTNAQFFDELKQEQKRIERIVQSVSEGIVVLDPQGHIIQINQVMLDLLAVPENLVLGQNHKMFINIKSKSMDDLKIDPIEQSLDDKEDYQDFHWLVCGPNHEQYVPIKMYINPLIDDEQIFQGMIVTIYDRTDDEEKLLSAKDSFIATVGHELRTPLSIIKFYAELIREKPFSCKEQEEDFNVLDQAVERMRNRLEQIIEISNLKSGERKVNIEQVDIAPLLEEINGDNRKAAKDKKIKLNIVAPKPGSIVLEADKYALKRILQVLVSNAINFTDKGSVDVTIHLSEDNNKLTPVKKAANANYAIIQVQDTGKGFSEEDQQKIFQPFYQKGGAIGRDESKGGLGLGLHLVQLLVMFQMGNLWVNSQIDIGSTFFISLPISKGRPDPK